ncbi:RuBisCO accumulation factor 1 [Leptolyngbya sp. FACHB-17]|uniref:RuBisCO accumulation factor 1 n=1 Tax=unclassified Leptolyngbya TaxID=2650499 RepID=UPI0016815E7B|nr:RuBisCO accumulation factor 1 [Leptolyngbya sp. FACHB-17]MBD2082519.1 hypothetical protein [Leptolyngbya sp. FACHB-17]
MTETPQELPNADELLLSLRRKEGSWVEWAHACQTLQKAGYTPQAIFEATGFEPIHQNQITVAAQVFDSMLKVGVSDAVRSYFGNRASDILYELRILSQSERAAAAELVFEKNLDTDEVHEVARALKDYSRLSKQPEAFTAHPGDAVAYQAWKSAKEKTDLQERSRLIARGLKFAHSETARKAIESLLTDFTVTPKRPAPRLPVYRLESDDQLPRILPVAGKMPLTIADLHAVPMIEETGAFALVQFSGTGAWITVPGWQVIRSAEDPVALLCDSDRLPTPLAGNPEEVIVVLDRSERQWQLEHYFAVANGEQLELQWFEEAPTVTLLGRVILVMRPKKVLDEAYSTELWQIDE